MMNKFFVTMAPAVQSKLGIEGYVIEADDYRARDGFVIFNTANDPDALVTFSNSAIVSVETVTDEEVEYVDEETFTTPTDPL